MTKIKKIVATFVLSLIVFSFICVGTSFKPVASSSANSESQPAASQFHPTGLQPTQTPSQPAQATNRPLFHPTNNEAANCEQNPGCQWINGQCICRASNPKSSQRAIGMPNPASVYCTDHGGYLTYKETPQGTIGYCHLPDGTTCDEWEFYNGNCGPEQCHKEFESCGDPSNCCPGLICGESGNGELKCIQQQPQPCAGEFDQCSDKKPCCQGLTCDENGYCTQTSQPCAGEFDQCSDKKPCCQGLTCGESGTCTQQQPPVTGDYEIRVYYDLGFPLQYLPPINIAIYSLKYGVKTKISQTGLVPEGVSQNHFEGVARININSVDQGDQGTTTVAADACLLDNYIYGETQVKFDRNPGPKGSIGMKQLGGNCGSPCFSEGSPCPSDSDIPCCSGSTCGESGTCTPCIIEGSSCTPDSGNQCCPDLTCLYNKCSTKGTITVEAAQGSKIYINDNFIGTTTGDVCGGQPSDLQDVTVPLNQEITIKAVQDTSGGLTCGCKWFAPYYVGHVITTIRESRQIVKVPQKCCDKNGGLCMP